MRDTEVIRRKTVPLRRLVDPRSVRVPDKAIEASVLHHDHEHVLEVLQILARVRPGRTCQQRQPDNRSQPANRPVVAPAADRPVHHDSFLRMTRSLTEEPATRNPQTVGEAHQRAAIRPATAKTSGSRAAGTPLDNGQSPQRCPWLPSKPAG